MANLTMVASGYQAVEGPAIDADGNLYFSDTIGGGVYRLRPAGDVEVIVPKRKGAGGITLHAEGGIVISGRDVSHIRDGETRVIITREDAPAREGTTVGGFNDITADRVGRVFAGTTRFTQDGAPAPGELLMVTGTHEATVVYEDVGMTNGIAQSADGVRLYHADTERQRIIVSDITDDSVPVPVTEFRTTISGRPDGVAADADGGLWVAWGGFVIRFDADGLVDQQISMPADHVLNCCFAGDELTDLFVVTMDNTDRPELGGCIYRMPVGIRGAPVPPARV
ncbi:MAG TPA: SMP-30/gluconolactonase/LRE family protein [Acidimicrobiales bacterium]|nr:SMP-30/gluconolactonase/LRE family protein [Acidimicrobiales bacterium]